MYIIIIYTPLSLSIILLLQIIELARLAANPEQSTPSLSPSSSQSLISRPGSSNVRNRSNSPPKRPAAVTQNNATNPLSNLGMFGMIFKHPN